MLRVKKMLMVGVMSFAVAGTSNLVMAGCGTCGGGKDHTHAKKASCEKCAHAKVCDSADCADKAHDAKCACKKAPCKKCIHAKVCDSADCTNKAHDAKCTCAKKSCKTCAHAKVCDSTDCTDKAHDAKCTCPKKGKNKKAKKAA